MLDINFIKENKNIFKLIIKKKKVNLDLDSLIQLDEKRRNLIQSLDKDKSFQNNLSKKIHSIINESERQNEINSVQKLKAEIQEKELELRKILKEYNSLMLQVPNIIDPSVPDGDSDKDNLEIKKWGRKTEFNFTPKSHIELMKNLKLADFDRGVKVHGFRGYFLKGDGAMLCWAIWNYANDFFLKRGFTPVIPPIICRRENFYGTGHLPGDAQDLYQTQDNDFLAGTSEVPIMGHYAGEILDNLEKNPIKILGFSPCFRREAGSYGRDTSGLIRVHEFFKIEQVILCESNHQTSIEFHKWINKNTEEFIESLGIPYRRVCNCTGDLGLGQVKKYDVELWVPLEKKYREISSASYFHDFQTRRFNIRYRDKSGKIKFAHSLNCTAAPTPRILVSLIENFQNEKGQIIVPEVLRKYFGKDLIS